MSRYQALQSRAKKETEDFNQLIVATLQLVTNHKVRARTKIG